MLRRTLAGVVTFALMGGGLLAAAPAAIAAESTEYVADITTIAEPPNDEAESEVYNEWHFGPGSGRGGANEVVQQPNGFTVDAGAQIQILKGNGNDAVSPFPNDGDLADPVSIADLAAGLDIVASDAANITYQIPVFYTTNPDDEVYSFTTLRQPVGGGSWVSSKAIGTDIDANQPYTLDAIVAALGDDAHPIAAGFLVYGPSADVLVSSFTANGVTTHFYPEPGAATNSGSGEEVFVHSDEIRPNAESYDGWHEETASNDAALGSFGSVAGEGEDEFLGLQVTGKSQLIYGYDEDKRPANSLSQILDGGFTVNHQAITEDYNLQTQIPIVFYREGMIGQQFTTLRTPIPADGVVSPAAQWQTSRAIGDIPANGSASLAEILDALGNYEVLGHGFTVDSGQVLIESVSFNGYEHVFTQDATVPDDGDDDGNGEGDGPGEDEGDGSGDENGGGTGEENGSGDGSGEGTDNGASEGNNGDKLPNTGMDPTIALAAFGLLAAGGAALAVSRRFAR
ncbi:MAG: LPXTG cell wall anchor domain-containing protein [Ancrocorticia sp.]|uniref:LPXTG cell wall anchor domain-containing protein n=1 Tax=Ancrocorticia sp. TaxID=2593684 RepID=UPI003F8EBE56